ncbi:iron-containing redox enzyme family protein [Actinophytocola sp.]|uniref:iron-containing redox enzyme family protein n=1 Tax=Actinophytocola sp. TaxID=1872138 RepID=UPI002ED628FC
MRTEAFLPTPRGPLSAAVVALLRDGTAPRVKVAGDPFGEDLAVALHTCYELHYQGFAGVAAEWEWSPVLLGFRHELERVFEEALRDSVKPSTDVGAVLEELLVEPVPGNGVSHFLRDEGERWQLMEYLVHRSIYHHKEADPHAWVIPRLWGQAKAALVAVEFDEFGGGRGDRVHAQLYRDMMAASGLDTGYLSYFDDVPAPVIAVVNMMSMFGLHRRLRGAMVGHFAAAEITTPPSAARLVKAIDRLGGDPHFFAEHVEADAVHEQILRHDVIGDLLAREPDLAADVVFGIQATEFLESRFAEHVLTAWHEPRTSLRRPLAS